MACGEQVMVTEKVTGTGLIADGDPIDVVGLYILSTGTQGQIVLQNDTNTQFDMDTPANQQGITIVNFPAGKIPFPDGCNVATLSNITSAVIFYRKRV